MKIRASFIFLFCHAFIMSISAAELFVEAESFTGKGGWVVDQQCMDQMGSPYLMAHGLGKVVADARTTVEFPATGTYRLWVRTFNWTAPWYKGAGPGQFKVKINGTAHPVVLGSTGEQWMWQDAGKVHIKNKQTEIALQDLTGFNGRCDALFFTKDESFVPPSDIKTLSDFRRDKLNIKVQDAGHYDLVVMGGGVAGCCAAISAARLGCKVALIQNRPVLGGNNSSEVRVGLSGQIFQQPYPKLGSLLDELGGVGFWNNQEAEQNPGTERSQQIAQIIRQHPEKKIHNAGPASNYEDEKKERLIRKEPNIRLFLNMHVYKVEKEGNTIVSVTGKDIMTGEESVFKGRLFADCTGDGTIGFLAGADYRMGRESRTETGEPRAPEKADQLVMGTSVQWYADDTDANTPFPACPWAVSFNEETCQPGMRGDWDWETGMNQNQITDIEFIRDYGLRTVFGNWDFLKNRSVQKESCKNKQLSWVAYIGGKRESRRLLGDLILKEQDLLNHTVYEDASFTTTWGVDLHYPKEIPGMKESPFLSYADVQDIEPYAVPYRCLYSGNIDNLFMAGRNISVTHVALGTIRVMRTGGMMGEVVGMAAYICKTHQTNPRSVYSSYLSELKELMKKGVGTPGFPEY